MRQLRIFHLCMLCIAAITLIDLGATFADGPSPLSPPDIKESLMRVEKVNGGTLVYRDLEDIRGGQNAALWIADETKTVKGILFSLNNGYDTYETHMQQCARSLDMALYSSLIRWSDFHTVLPDQLEKLGKKLDHPEVSNVPWVILGGSRNVGASIQFARMRPDRQDLLLAMLWNGGPGTGINLGKKPRAWEYDSEGNAPHSKDVFQTIPMMTVNGSVDPFVSGMAWQTQQYPKLREHDLPAGVAVDWGCGHSPQEGWMIWWPFVKAVMAHRYPHDADPTVARVNLKPMRYEDGWLIGPVDWKEKWGEKMAPVKDWQGDTANTIWLPDQNTARVFQAMVSQVDDVMIEVRGEGADSDQLLRLVGLGTKTARDIQWHSDSQENIGLAKLEQAVQKGFHTVWASFTDAQGARKFTQPIMIVHGQRVRWQDGYEARRQASKPINAIQLPANQKQTLQALQARRDAADVWKLAFEDDFSKGIKEDWYNYYLPDPKNPPKRMKEGHDNDKREHVDGAMQLYSDLHAVAMLPQDWPDEIRIEYRTRAIGDRVCDLSVVMSGHHSGSDFPWREGMLYQFGAHFNQGSFFLVHEQPHKNWKDYDSGVRATVGSAPGKPGQWHDVVVERLGNTAKAWVDGKLANTRTITDSDYQRFFGRKVGLYTFQSTAQFDDVKIFIRGYSDPASVEPMMPDEAALKQVALSLAEKMADPFQNPRDNARSLVRQYAAELAPAYETLLEEGKIKDDKVSALIERLIANRPPMPE